MKHTWRVVLLYAALTFLLAYPLTLSPASTLLADDPDAHLFLWTLGWDAHAFLHQPLSIFDANIYYPQHNTLAYSENLIGSAFFAAPVIWLTGNPVLALNVVVLLSCVLCGLGTYLLLRRLGVGVAGSTLGGVVFAFSPARFYRLSQLHLGPVEWVPFTLAYLHAYLDGGRKRDLRLAVGFFSLQALTSGHGAVFAVVAVLLLLTYRMALGDPIAPNRRLTDLGVPGALTLLPAVVAYLPYRAVQAELGTWRPLDIGTPSAESFLASPTTLHTYLHAFLRAGPHINETANGFLFPGYVPILLAVIALFWYRPGVDAGRPQSPGMAWRRLRVVLEVLTLAAIGIAVYITWSNKDIVWRVGRTVVFQARRPLNAWVVVAVLTALRVTLLRRAPLDLRARTRGALLAGQRWGMAKRTDAAAFYAVLTAVSIALSIAAPYGLWPYVYRLPGFSLIRVQSRFMILGALGVAVLAGIGFDRVAAQRSLWTRRILGVAIGGLMVAEFSGIPLKTYPFEVPRPAVEQWLDHQPKPFVVAEIPWAYKERLQTTYMLHSMVHWQKTVQGYSGMQAPMNAEIHRLMQAFPDPASLEALTELGVTYVVVHREMYEADVWKEIDPYLAQFAAWLTLAHEEGQDLVYSLHRPQQGAVEGGAQVAKARAD